MGKITRRAAMTGAAALAAVPAIAPHADAELLGLGQRLDDLRRRYAASRACWAPVQAEYARRWRKWQQDHPGDPGVGVYSGIMKEVDHYMAPTEPHPDHVVCAPGMEDMQRAIMALPAVTLAGLAVKARLAAFAAPGMWDESDEDADWDDLCIRNLIDAVIEAAAAAEQKA